ncbi:MAG: hypothetical protein ABIJ09_16200 [Pseudomonadota bacterium]
MAGADTPHPGALARFTRLLRAQGTGVACGLATVVLLAVGSVVMAATRDGASAGIALDDIRPFFTRPSIAHLWFYLLVPTLGLYALSTLLATWHSLLQRWRGGQRRLTTYGPSVLHLSFLVALLAHGVGGLWSEELGGVLLDQQWRPLPGGGEARLSRLDEKLLPLGGTRQIDARILVRTPDGQEREHAVAYNAPLSTGWGQTLYLVLKHSQRLGAIVLRRGDATCSLEPQGEPCALGDAHVVLRAVQDMGAHGHTLARVGVRSGDGTWTETWLTRGRDLVLTGGATIQLERFEQRPALLLRGRRAPGNPIALVAALMLVGGLALMWRRFMPARRLATGESR